MPAPPRPAPHRDALWIQVVAVGAVIEVDLVEGLRGTANDATAVVQPVPVLGDDDLAQGHSAQELTLGGGGEWHVWAGFCPSGRGQVGRASPHGRGPSRSRDSGLSTHPRATCSVLEAGDGHYVGPVVGLHEDTSCMCAGHVEGRGAVLVGALDAGAGQLLHALAAVHTLLQRMGCRVTSKDSGEPSSTGGSRGQPQARPGCLCVCVLVRVIGVLNCQDPDAEAT